MSRGREGGPTEDLSAEDGKMSRREFVKKGVKGTASLAVASALPACAGKEVHRKKDDWVREVMEEQRRDEGRGNERGERRARGEEEAPDAEIPHEVDVLQTAKSLAKTQFKDWRFGSNPDFDLKRKRVNCVRFLCEVLKEVYPGEISRRVEDVVLIRNAVKNSKELQGFVNREDWRISGIQAALTKFLEAGEAVEPERAESGDFIQYWYKRRGKWEGHAGVLERVVKRRGGAVQAKVFGAHQSSGKIGTSSYWLDLNSPNKKVFIARYDSGKAEEAA